jgi:restriction system protein
VPACRRSITCQDESSNITSACCSAAGYGVDVTKAAGDFGADLVVRKDGRRILVQAKRYGKPVGVKAVQEAAAGAPYWKCDAAIVVANRSFTAAARKLAGANKIELWDRDLLAARIIEARLGSGRTAEASIDTSGQTEVPAPIAQVAPTCKRCGSPMVMREGRRGEFYGCSTFPRCRFTLPI